MTKKDFELIASVIAGEFAAPIYPGQRIVVFNLAHRMANKLAATHPKFQREKFLEACGIAETTTD